jgi:hypothetical protein
MAALRLELRASRVLAGTLALVHGAGAACLAALVPGVPGLALAVLILALGAATARDRALLRAQGSVRALGLGAGGAVTLELADGRRLAVRVGERRHVGPWWVVLPLKGESRRTLVVARDMLSPEEFRSLKLFALWGRVPVAAPPPHAA